ncbi:hypothetical protein [Caballeronia sp. GAWG1-1]|uniref:hypothetical protein n=1 Tax=Caballeronia sp. GAWG1-1 TaxID=2921742 RepID=UPI0020279F54|nr:hypothetical protein [Caballeronia sp. GAWG1-1]
MYWNAVEGDEGRLGLHDPALNVRTISDLNTALLRNLDAFQEFDCIVGVPRSGLLVGTMLALHLNLPFFHLHDFLNGRFDHTYTRRKSSKHRLFEDGRHANSRVLIVDDSSGNGVTFADLRRRFADEGFDTAFNIKYMAAFCLPAALPRVDLHLELVPFPRVFEWNMMHHDNSRFYCVDLDGVLCVDPTPEQNDDGPAYEAFCLGATPRLIPTVPLGAIVTARLEKYRAQTETWLQRQGIRYERLIMCNLPTGAERRRVKAHAKMKADAYRTLGGMLFVESDPAQAREIRTLTGKPVFCFGIGLAEPIDPEILPSNNERMVHGPENERLQKALEAANTRCKELEYVINAVRRPGFAQIKAQIRSLMSAVLGRRSG